MSSVVNPYDNPSTPTVTATPGNQQISLSWPVPSAGSGIIKGYTVTYGTDSDYSKDTTSTTCTPSLISPSCNITGLTNGTSYFFNVTADNGSLSSAGHAQSIPYGLPGNPSALSAASSDSQSVLSWTAPTDTNGSAISGYEVQSSTNGTTWNTVSANTGNSTTTYTAQSLANGTAYHFRVAAINAAGNSTGYTYLGGDTTPGGTTTPFTLPTATIAYPSDASTYGTNYTGTITGTAAATTPGDTLSSVKLAIHNTTNDTYWNGTTWQAGNTSVTTSGTTSWSYNLSSTHLSSGSDYAISATSTDSASHTSTANTVSFNFDSSAPTAAFSYPASGSTLGTNYTGSITGTAAADNGLTVVGVALNIHDTTNNTYWNGSAWDSTSTNSVPATGTTSWTYGLAAGSLVHNHDYSVVATTTDSVGNIGSTSPLSFTFNNTTPIASISYPNNSSTLGANYTGAITGTSSADGTLTSSSVALIIENTTNSTYWNGSAWVATTTSVLASGSANWSYVLSSSNLTNTDSYSIAASVTDSGANVGTSDTNTFTYLTTPPTSTISYPANSSTFGGSYTGALTGTASATAPYSISSVGLSIKDTTNNQYWNGSTWDTNASDSVTATGTSNWSYPLASSALHTTDSYSVTAYPVDSASGTSTSSASSFEYLTTAPVASVSYPSNGASYGANYTGTLTGSASVASPYGISSVNLTIKDTTNNTYWNGTTWVGASTTVTATGTANWTYGLAVSHLTDADTYSVTATTVDSGGNSSSSAPSTFTTILATPTSSVTYPSNTSTLGANYAGTLTGTASATSPHTIASVALSIHDTTNNTYWNGTAWNSTATNTVTASGTTSWSYGLPATNLTSTDHYTLTAIATDSSTNTAPSSPDGFTYDTTSPTSLTAYPVDGTTYGTNWSGVISGTSAATTPYAVSSVSVTIHDTTNNTYWNGTTWDSNSADLLPATGTNSWLYNIAKSSLTNTHSYTITTQIVDNASNSGAGTPASFTYDTTAPTATISYPNNISTLGTNYTGSISGTSSSHGNLTGSSVGLTIEDFFLLHLLPYFSTLSPTELIHMR